MSALGARFADVGAPEERRNSRCASTWSNDRLNDGSAISARHGIARMRRPRRALRVDGRLITPFGESLQGCQVIDGFVTLFAAPMAGIRADIVVQSIRDGGWLTKSLSTE